MTKPKEINYIWHKQTLAKGCQTIDCAVYDPITSYRAEPTGHYVLIRPDFVSLKIEAAICNRTHEIIKVFRGGKAQDVYDGIFRYEQQHRLQWFKSKSHMAYLGKELKKAELALVLGQNNYFQE